MNFLLNMPSYKFTLSEYLRSMYFLKDLGVPAELIDCFKKVYDFGDNVNPYELLNTITYDQVGRSKKLVYNLNK